MMKRRLAAFFLSLALVAGWVGVAAQPAFAQVDTGLDAIGSTIKLSATDPRVIAANIINVLLGLIGIVLVVLIIYGGFVYMTSGGDEKKISSAKGIITSAIIGLVIVLSSWAIARFVIDKLLQATQEGGGGAVVSGTGGGGLGGGFAGGGGAEAFRAKSITPAGSIAIRNVVVKVVFNKAVDPASSAGIVVQKNGGSAVAGVVKIDGRVATFTPSAACPAPNADRSCFEANADFIVKVGSAVRSMAGQSVTCSGFGSLCEGAFRTGSLVDTRPPTVKIIFPLEGQSVKANGIVSVSADASDDAGVSTVEFTDGANLISVEGPSASTTPLTFTAKTDWFTTGAALGVHTINAVTKDVDSNTSEVSRVNVVVRAEHCFNGKLDGPSETGIDCGGDSSSPEYCGACAAASCTKASDCSSGACSAGKCVVQPIMSFVSPLNGRSGTFVTISGTNFGFTAGTVTFLGAAGAGDDKVAVAPAACSAAGVATWTNTQVTVATPEGAVSGPIEIKNSGSGLSDRTDDGTGPSIPSYVVDGKTYPGLCAVIPSSATVGGYVDAVGQGFGASSGQVLFASAAKTSDASIESWSDGRIRLKVPVVDVGAQAVRVKTSSAESNSVAFTVLGKTVSAAPILSSIDPAEGPHQQYLTLFGSNFGYTLGKVVFTGPDGSEALGDTSFPAACSEGFWRDDRIVIKVPSSFKTGGATPNGAYQVRIERPDGVVSNNFSFTVNNGIKIAPGICAIQPSAGPRGTVVKLFGDRFGTEKPSVTFYRGVAAAVDSNTNQDLMTKVPEGALTGPVSLKVADISSNGINFQIRNCNESPDICASGKEQCCPTGECRASGDSCGVKAIRSAYAWQTSTGLIPVAPRVIEECSASATPSPSPWLGRAGGDQIPVNASVYMRFSRILLASSALPTSFRLFKCTSKSGEPCATQEKVDFTVSLTSESTEQSLVELIPAGFFAASTTYEVKVLTTVKADGADGANMEQNKSCPVGPAGEKYGYCFRFKTRASTEPSAVGSVTVAPSTYTMTSRGDTAPYKAEPRSATDACIVLNCRKFDWDWYTGSKAAKGSDDHLATISHEMADGRGACLQLATAISDTGPVVPARINAELKTTGPAGKGNLFVTFLPPKVEAYFPNCDEACANVRVWALFTGAMDETSVKKPGNVELRKCFNENCVETELSAPIPLPAGAVDLMPRLGSSETMKRLVTIKVLDGTKPLLEAGAFYRVLLKGGVGVPDGMKGANGVPLDGRNHPLGFQWNFRVKVGAAALCKADRVDVVPQEKYETAIGDRQLFVATPYTKPDTCSANGQTIDALTTTGWTTDDPKIADLYLIGGKPVDTSAPLPIGCGGTCLATGAVAQFGKVAVCGNGIVETTDKNWCKTIGGASCVTMDAGSKAGEQCEPSLHGEACSPDTCLFKPVKPVTQPGGTCGDGTIQYDKGEACDPSLRCMGGSLATPGVPDFSLCNTDVTKAACTAAGGTCGVQTFRGCSANCRHLGALVGKTTCGNSDALGDGKDCDDGNTAAGDGCSSMCLHEGSSPSTVLPSICGNAVLEPGETCEKPSVAAPWSAVPGCSSKTCLHTGTIFCGTSTDSSCCGNSKIEIGEDCDGGAGCSTSCLFMGSSATYSDPKGGLAPSFCGNGILERGEQCESGAPSNKVAEAIGYTTVPSLDKAYAAFSSPKGGGMSDSKQLAYIVGEKLPDASGLLATKINATLEGKKGSATYGIQCGQKDEAVCPAGAGLDQYGCCSERPEIDFQYPKHADTGVCRNILIQAGFNVSMDPGSVVNNVEISESTSAGSCPAGTTEVLAQSVYRPGFFGWVHHLWDDWLTFVTGRPVYAIRWCKGKVTGQLVPFGGTTTTKLYAFQLDNSLAKNTQYRVRFMGDNSTTPDPLSDNADLSKRLGVKSQRGVVRPNTNEDKGALSWYFTTGDKICNVNVVTISDVTPDPKLPERPHPFLFTNPGNAKETRTFSAQAQALVAGVAVPLSSTADYDWKWLPWSSSDVTVVKHPVAGLPPTQATAEAQMKNGNAVLTAALQISADSVSVPSSTGMTVKGMAPVTVLTCVNPWPASGAPFRDAEASVNFKAGEPFFGVPAYNFSTVYCRDSGTSNDVTDDLPALTINQIAPTPLDTVQGIFRQYLFTYPDDTGLPAPYRGQGLKEDGIGIRIVANPQHLSPEEWYASRGFTGSPTSLFVDGYPAVKDGTTVYVAATNRPKGDRGKIYSNIYLISYNPDAKPVTLQIANQMVASLAFNINKEFTDQSNVCVNAAGAPYTDAKVGGGAPISCVADWQCLQYNSATHCDSTKLKIVRDTQRLVDFQAMNRIFENVKDPSGKYPQLTGGTFLQSQTNSVWPSWTKEFTAAAGTPLPTDPVNKLLTCGKCSGSSAPCGTNADCPASQTCNPGTYVGSVWTPSADIDPATCWNQKAHAFICPSIPEATVGGVKYGVSRLYRYVALSGALRYDIGAEFEVPPETGKLDEWWSPPLAEAVYRCAVPSLTNTYCAASSGTSGDDKFCRSVGGAACPNGICNTCQTGTDAGKFCAAATDCAGGAVCAGDDKVPVVVGSCRQVGGSFTFSGICQNMPVGDTGRCGDGVLNSGELCDAGMTQLASCSATGGAPGHKKQVCDLKDCKRFVDDPAMPQCVADTKCGNGRVDKACSISGSGCLTTADCGGGGGVCAASEICDDGSSNGAYGHCNTTCTGYAGYCGDSVISTGELCDLGSKNGDYESGCGLDCRTDGPKCGDTLVNGPEQCDGQTETTQSKICSDGKKACTTDADCAGGTCGTTDATKSCVGFKITDLKTGISYDTQHMRTCNPVTSPDKCTWPTWSECRARGGCGDGLLDPSEECDAGSANKDTGACTTSCKKNVCGDAKPYLGIEECDNGVDNGKITCSADYGSMCLSCTTSCKWQATAGGYCSDGIKNGPEQCDIKDGLEGVTCESLGYDYAKSSVVPKPTGKIGEFDFISTPGGVECSSGCSYAGCARCTDPVEGIGLLSTIKGTVRDGVYANQAVPKARVTLFFKGVKISETYTKDDGTFVFSELQAHPSCSSYKIVVDFYGDNPNTKDFDEALAGGYWPFTSNPFYAKDFNKIGIENEDGIIFLLPRVQKYETLVAVNWSGSLKKAGGTAESIFNVDIDAHLIFPTGYAYKTLPPGGGRKAGYSEGFPDTYYDYISCAVDSADCLVDLQYRTPGLSNLALIPHARMYCYKSDAPGEYCANFDKAPEIVKYSRKYASAGSFNFYLVDWGSRWQAADHNFTNPIKLNVKVVTDTGVKTYKPDDGKMGKVWSVFTQDALTGEVSFNNTWITAAEAGTRGLVNIGF